MLPEKSLYYEPLHMNNSQKRSVWRWKKMCVRQIIFIFRMWIFTPRQLLLLHSYSLWWCPRACDDGEECRKIFYVCGKLENSRYNFTHVHHIIHTASKEHIKVNEMHVKNKWKMFVKSEQEKLNRNLSIFEGDNFCDFISFRVKI